MTLRHGSRAASWKTKPISRFCRAVAGTSPSTAIRPLVGSIRSAITRSKVDFPQPEGPSKVRKLPRGIVRSMFSSAVTVPRSVVKRTVTRSQTTASALAAGAGSLRASATAIDAQPTLARTLLVASRILVVMTSASLGAPAVNCFSSSYSVICSCPHRRIEGAPAVGLGVGIEGKG